MNMKRSNFLFFLMLFVITSIFISNAYAGGFAAGPSKILFSKVLRGGYAEQEIYLYNPEEIITDIEISAGGPFANWIFFHPGKKFSIPAKSSYRLKAYIEPPADIANGVYNGTIYVLSKPRRIPVVEGYGLSIETAITLFVFVDITGEQIIRYGVKSISAETAEEGDPISFTFTGMNTGNVRTSPVARIEIYNWNRSALMKRESFTLEETLPTTERTYVVNVSSNGLSEGQYWANVSVLVSGNLIGSDLKTFDIVKKGSLARTGELLHVSVNTPWARTGDIVRIDPVFKNTGQVPASAKFKGEVYIDEMLLDTLESDVIEIQPGASANLTVYYTPKRPGRYTVSGAVYYSGKITYEKGTVINVLPLGSLPEEANPIEKNLSFAGAAILIILTLLYLAHSSRKNNASKYESIKTVSGRFDTVESSLDKMTREAKRMSAKIRRLKSSQS